MATKTEILLNAVKFNKLTREQYDAAKAAGQINENEFYMTGETLGEGDMLKSVYDKDNDGIVDNSKKVNGLTVETAVPQNAKFTDTTYGVVSTTANGLAPKLPGNTNTFLRGDGTWTTPSGQGDMTKAVYDTNGDGIVNKADVATSANKVTNSLTVKLNSGTTEGTNLFTFNGSAAKTVNITPSNIGTYTKNEIDSIINGVNLLDNSDFTNPVNQREATDYTSRGGCIDRWKIWDDNNQQAMSVGASGIYIKGQFYQILLNEVAPVGETYTFSVKAGGRNVMSITGVQIQQRFDDVLLTLGTDASGKYTQVTIDTTNSGLVFLWAKLEKGNKATDWHPRGFTEELAICQRFFVRYSGKSRAANIVCGKGLTSDLAMFTLALPSNMRIVPTMSGNYKMSDGSFAINITSTDLKTMCTNILYFSLHATGLTKGTPYFVYVPIGGYLDVSADL